MAGGIRQDDSEEAELAEINVTPFIDVMLVLLIIFMVAAPLSTVDIAVDLPVSSAAAKPRPDKPVYLTLKTDLSVAVGEHAIARPDLVSTLNAATDGKKDTRLFLRADRAVPYGEIINLTNVLSRAGYMKIALVGLEDASGGAKQPAEAK